jgi:hypothetical protein
VTDEPWLPAAEKPRPSKTAKTGQPQLEWLPAKGSQPPFYFFRRYTLSAWIALATVPVLLVYKIAVIDR